MSSKCGDARSVSSSASLSTRAGSVRFASTKRVDTRISLWQIRSRSCGVEGHAVAIVSAKRGTPPRDGCPLRWPSTPSRYQARPRALTLEGESSCLKRSSRKNRTGKVALSQTTSRSTRKRREPGRSLRRKSLLSVRRRRTTSVAASRLHVADSAARSRVAADEISRKDQLGKAAVLSVDVHRYFCWCTIKRRASFRTSLAFIHACCFRHVLCLLGA